MLAAILIGSVVSVFFFVGWFVSITSRAHEGEFELRLRKPWVNPDV